MIKQRLSFLFLFCLFAITSVAYSVFDSTPTPVGVIVDVIDIPCRYVIDPIPSKLAKAGISSTWVDEGKNILTVEPFVSDGEMGSVFSKLRHAYRLFFECRDEIETHITGEVVLEGMNNAGQWIQITDTPTIEKYGVQFMNSIDF
jgi:hypothetical protein